MSVTQSFIGKDGFTWWVGQVEKNSDDPAGLGRVKVRIAGWYTGENYKQNIPTDMLPWAHVMQPTTEVGIKNVGKSNNRLGEGAIVIGFFLDGEEAQQPVVMGILRSFVNTGTNDIDKLKAGEWIADIAATGGGVQGVPTAEIPHNQPLGGQATSGKASTGKNSQKAEANGALNTNPGFSDDGTPGQDTGPAGVGATSLPASAANPSGIPNACPRPVSDGKKGPLKTFEDTLRYMLCDLGVTLSELVSNNKGNYISVVTGKLVKVDEIMVKIKRFISYAINGLFAELKVAFANLIGDAVTQILAKFASLPFVYQLLIDTAIQIITKFMCDFERINSFEALIKTVQGIVVDLFNQLINTAVSQLSKVLSSSLATVDTIMAKVSSGIQTAMSILGRVAKAIQVAKDVSAAAKAAKNVTEFFELANKSTALTSLLTFVISTLLDILFPDPCRRNKSDDRSKYWIPLYGTTSCGYDELKGYEKVGNTPYEKPGAPWDKKLLASALTFLDNYPDGGYTQSSAKEGSKFKREVDHAGNSKVTDNEGNTHEHKGHNETKIVEQDQVEHTKGNRVIEVDGDLHLKVNGDFKLEVAGAYEEFTSSGTETDKNGNPKDGGRARESSMIKASDFSYETKGSYHIGANKISLYGNEGVDIKAQKGRIYMQGASILGVAPAIGWASAVETNLVGFQQHNVIGLDPLAPTGLTGQFNEIFGQRITTFMNATLTSDITTHLAPTSHHAYTQATAATYTVTHGAGGAINFIGGAGTAFTVNVGTGAISMACGGVFSMSTAGKMFITAIGACTITSAGPLTLLGVPIMLN